MNEEGTGWVHGRISGFIRVLCTGRRSRRHLEGISRAPRGSFDTI